MVATAGEGGSSGGGGAGYDGSGEGIGDTVTIAAAAVGRTVPRVARPREGTQRARRTTIETADQHAPAATASRAGWELVFAFEALTQLSSEHHEHASILHRIS